MTIPKIVHYCWFGGGALSEEAKESIETWKKHLPEYEIMLWNEDNFDFDCNRYASEAYKAGKYAYASDYVRLYALKQYGGIYFDTDVEVLKSFDDLLTCEAFIGYEGKGLIGTGIIGAIKSHPWIDKLLEAYEHKAFFLEDGTYDTTTNSVIITNIMSEAFGWINEDSRQILEDGIVVFPSETLSAKDSITGEIFANDKTYSIHHFG